MAVFPSIARALPNPSMPVSSKCVISAHTCENAFTEKAAKRRISVKILPYFFILTCFSRVYIIMVYFITIS
jgi:hypothetical protein